MKRKMSWVIEQLIDEKLLTGEHDGQTLNVDIDVSVIRDDVLADVEIYGTTDKVSVENFLNSGSPFAKEVLTKMVYAARRKSGEFLKFKDFTQESVEVDADKNCVKVFYTAKISHEPSYLEPEPEEELASEY